MALIANTEDKKGARKERSDLLTEFFESSVNSEKTIIPSVANAESQSEVSKTENGSNKQMTVTDKNRFVTESLELENRKSADEIESMRPALTTDTGNPVNAI